MELRRGEDAACLADIKNSNKILIKKPHRKGH